MDSINCKGLQYKFRTIPIYCLSNLSFDVSLFDDDHAMIIVTGCCLKFSESELVHSRTPNQTEKNGQTEANHTEKFPNNALNSSLPSPVKQNNERGYVEITNLSYVPNAHIDTYFGHVNLFFIRESKS